MLIKRLYQQIKQQCNIKSKKYKGFTICEEWLDFNTFKEWCLENNLKEGMTIYTDKNFSPDECEVVSSKESRNRNIKKKCLEKYGVDHYSKTQEYRDKCKNTCIKKYGKHFTQTEDYQKKYKEKLLEKYGVTNQFQRDEVKSKSKKTCLEKYGVEYPMQNKKVSKKTVDARINNGNLKLYYGKTIREHAKAAGITDSAMVYRIQNHGVDNAINKKISDNNLEILMENLLIQNNIDYEKQFRVDKKIADFRCGNLLIECDGLYWHCETKRHKTYHKEKREIYINNGYTPVFFYEDEILSQINKVKSIILNKLGKSKRIFARKCVIKEIVTKDSNVFFETNHLMGKGRGKSFGLYLDNKLVTAIRICKLKNGIDISRFCHIMGHNTIGGFSKLISHIEKILDPDFIQTFIDLRYGSGEYLTDLGFELISENLSFQWTKAHFRTHRMNFPGNTGYNHGLVKLWDYGQRKFIKKIK